MTRPATDSDNPHSPGRVAGHDYWILTGNPLEGHQVVPTVQVHKSTFGKAPRELSGDRGPYTRENENAARAQGVRRVSLLMPGHKTARRRRYEKQPWFRAAQGFRAGIEARISRLKRAPRTKAVCALGPVAGGKAWQRGRLTAGPAPTGLREVPSRLFPEPRAPRAGELLNSSARARHRDSKRRSHAVRLQSLGVRVPRVQCGLRAAGQVQLV